MDQSQFNSPSPPSQQTQTTSHSLHHHQPTPARKCLISHARTLPKQTIVWIQGTIVAMTDNQIAIDDGSGIARVQVNPKRDVAHPAASLRVGSYIMAAGQMVAKLKGFKMGMRALSVRDLTENVPFLQTLWNLEVVDAYLYHQKNQGSVATRT